MSCYNFKQMPAYAVDRLKSVLHSYYMQYEKLMSRIVTQWRHKTLCTYSYTVATQDLLPSALNGSPERAK
jgi:hypothetical protein